MRPPSPLATATVPASAPKPSSRTLAAALAPSASSTPARRSGRTAIRGRAAVSSATRAKGMAGLSAAGGDPGVELRQVAHDQVRHRAIRIRPAPAVAVEPDRGHAGAVGADDVEVRIVADMPDAGRRQPEQRAGVVEDAPVRLGAADLAREHRAVEVLVQPDHRQVGVAVGQRDDALARGQRRQRGADLGVQLDLVAGGVEQRVGGVDRVRRVQLALGEGALQAQPAQGAVVMAQLGPFGVDAVAQGAHRQAGEALRDRRRMFVEEGLQRLLAALDHRADRPQRVVQVEGQAGRGRQRAAGGRQHVWAGSLDGTGVGAVAAVPGGAPSSSSASAGGGEASAGCHHYGFENAGYRWFAHDTGGHPLAGVKSHQIHRNYRA